MLNEYVRSFRRSHRANDPRWDGMEQYSRAKRAAKMSKNFIPGERIETTLFTVIGPGYGNVPGERNWRSVEVLCDPRYGGCGTIVQIPYVYLYQHPRKYSCGCLKRIRFNAVDYCGATHTGYKNNRKLTIISQDPKTGVWNYVCECCGETGELSRNDGNTALIKLKREANRPCIHSLVFFSVYELIEANKIRRTTLAYVHAEDDLAAQIKALWPAAEVIRGAIRGEANRVRGANITRGEAQEMIRFVESTTGKPFKEVPKMV